MCHHVQPRLVVATTILFAGLPPSMGLRSAHTTHRYTGQDYTLEFQSAGEGREAGDAGRVHARPLWVLVEACHCRSPCKA